MNILITNDDGIEAPGIRRLAEAAKEFGNVVVVAPASQCSAASHSITLRHSIEVHPHDFPVAGVKAYSCSGTPADCVRVGALNVMPQKPDVVLSGINLGFNMASDIQYSATAGAAFEAEFQGILAIALSESFDAKHHEVTDHYLHRVLEKLLKEHYVPGQILNVNFPGCSLSECKGILWDQQVSRLAYYEDHYEVLQQFPDGGVELQVEGVHTPRTEVGTDYGAIMSGYVSVGIARNIGYAFSDR